MGYNMKTEHLHHISKILGLILSESMKEDSGKEEFTIICQLKSTVDLLIKNIENPEETKKLNRLIKGKENI
jgi:hypothetical protein